MIIPNKNIIDATLDNHSKYGETRLEVPVGIAYKESIPQAREVLLAAIDQLKLILKTPPPKLVVSELGDSSVNLVAQVWINDAEQERAAHYAVIEACKLALDEANIQIPFPHMQLFVDGVEDAAVEQLKKVKNK